MCVLAVIARLTATAVNSAAIEIAVKFAVTEIVATEIVAKSAVTEIAVRCADRETNIGTAIGVFVANVIATG